MRNKLIYLDLLGVDMLLIDEAHNYKNLRLYSNLQIDGLPRNNDTQKALNTLLKVHWMLEQPKGKVVFATATPIANSISELWIMQQFLIPDILESRGLHLFDEWIHLFGQKSLKSELHHIRGIVGKERIRQYNNRPEMLKIAYQCVDVIGKDYIQEHRLLEEPLPITINEVSSLTHTQQDYIKYLVLRAIDVDNKVVPPEEDNHLKIIGDGRKCVLDERLVYKHGKNSLENKVNQIIYNTYRIWKATDSIKGVQLLFGDDSTPKADDRYTVYAHVKEALVALGVPEGEIAFIHDFDHENKRKRAVLKHQLSNLVNEGKIRIVLGSTQKLGTGVNVQRRVIAIHHMSIRFRPIDLEQRNGRAIRQGNLFDKVLIFYYVAKGINESSLDSFMWQIIKTKQDFIANALVDDGRRTIIEPQFEDSDDTLPASTLMAIAQGNPELKELSNKRKRLEELSLQQKAIVKAQAEFDARKEHLIERISSYERKIEHLEEAISDLNLLVGQEIDLFGETVVMGKALTQTQRAKIKQNLNTRKVSELDFDFNSIKLVARMQESFVQLFLETPIDTIRVSFNSVNNPSALITEIEVKINDYNTIINNFRVDLKNLESQVLTFDKHVELNQLAEEVDLLMAKYGELGDVPSKENIDCVLLKEFKKYSGVATSQPLTAEEIEQMKHHVSLTPSWQPSLDEAIASWKGDNEEEVAKALLLEQQFEEECIDWQKGLKELSLKKQEKIDSIVSHDLHDLPLFRHQSTKKGQEGDRPTYDPSHPLAKRLLN